MKGLKVQNTISTVELGCQINLAAIVDPDSKIGKSKFNATVIKISEPKATALVFSTKMVVMGVQSVESIEIAMNKFAEMLKIQGNNVILSNFQIKNVVGSFNCGKKINLQKLNTALHPLSSYEPELFPGVTVRVKEPKVTLVIFNSGKLFLTGGKNIGELKAALDTVYSKIIESAYWK